MCDCSVGKSRYTKKDKGSSNCNNGGGGREECAVVTEGGKVGMVLHRGEGYGEGQREVKVVGVKENNLVGW